MVDHAPSRQVWLCYANNTTLQRAQTAEPTHDDTLVQENANHLA